MRAEPEDRFSASEEPEETRSRRGILSILFAGIAVIAFGAAVWYAYTLGARSGSPSDTPVVVADSGPWKMRPEDPGGLKVPNQDKSIFDRLEPQLAEQREERLLPPPEEPVERPPPMPIPPLDAPAAAGPSFSAAAPPSTDAPLSSDATSPLAVDAGPASGEATAVTDQAASTPATNGDGRPAAADAAAEAEPAAPSTDVASLPPASATMLNGGGYRIQIAALRSEADARREWQRIQAANRDLLGNLDLSVQRADLGAERGVFYRLQAGPLEDKTLADMLCGKLKERNLGCLVVAR